MPRREERCLHAVADGFLSGTTVIETKSGAIIYASDTRRVTFAEGVQGFFVDKDGNKELITDFSKPKLLFKGKKNLTAEETAA